MKRVGIEKFLGWAAAACWLAAWFLPVIPDFNGWDAFIAALEGPFRQKLATVGEDALPQMLSALSNVVFVVLFAHWLRNAVTRPVLFLKIAIACLILDLYWVVQMLRAGERHGLLAGYYVWLAAFALLVAVGAIIVVSSRRTSRTPTAGTPA